MMPTSESGKEKQLGAAEIDMKQNTIGGVEVKVIGMVMTYQTVCQGHAPAEGRGHRLVLGQLFALPGATSLRVEGQC